MNHSDVIIIITVSLFITSIAGMYGTLKYIKLHTNPPMNTLIRTRGDIELQYIEPSRDNNIDLLPPEQVYSSDRVPCISEATYNTSESISNHLDLIEPQQVYDRVPSTSISSNPPSYNTLDLLQPQPVYTNWSSNPSTNISSWGDSLNIQRIPNYLNDLNINSCLEDSINLNYIFIVGILFLIVILSNSLLGLNPYNEWLYIIKIISIILILYYSTKFKISTAVILPLSINRISYLNDFRNSCDSWFWIYPL